MAISEEQIAEVTKRMFDEASLGRGDADQVMDRTSVEDVSPQKVDIYQQNVNKMRKEFRKSYPRGASTLTKKIAEEALDGLARQKRKAEVDSDYWKERGDKERAKMVKDQYMEECFLPAVEMVIIAATPDEVLNAKDILSSFDELSFEYGPGYTASYIRTAYGDQLGNTSNRSDGYVRENIRRIKGLAASDQIRAAYCLAKKVKDEIDNGNHTCSEDDYQMIARVATLA
jgi:hypothetical protein